MKNYLLAFFLLFTPVFAQEPGDPSGAECGLCQPQDWSWKATPIISNAWVTDLTFEDQSWNTSCDPRLLTDTYPCSDCVPRNGCKAEMNVTVVWAATAISQTFGHANPPGKFKYNGEAKFAIFTTLDDDPRWGERMPDPENTLCLCQRKDQEQDLSKHSWYPGMTRDQGWKLEEVSAGYYDVSWASKNFKGYGLNSGIRNPLPKDGIYTACCGTMAWGQVAFEVRDFHDWHVYAIMKFNCTRCDGTSYQETEEPSEG